MARYRIHEFDVKGHVAVTHVVECDTDEEAIVEFGRIGGRRPATELWLESRCVKRSVKPGPARPDARMR